MKTVTDLIEAFGGSTQLAKLLELPIPTVGAWKHRGSIHPDYFPAIIEKARELRISGVSLERLHSMRKERA